MITNCSHKFSKKVKIYKKKSPNLLTLAWEKNQVSSYSHLSNSRRGWNKRGWGAKVPKLINEEVGINVKGKTST